MMSAARPFVKWAGGKSRIAKQISDFFPSEFNKYYEPFLGSGAIYFTISPQKGVLNDLNKYLIGTYKIIRNQPKDLISRLKSIDSAYHSLPTLTDKAQYYYEARAKYNGIQHMNIEKAAQFIFLNKTGYNGMYRENNQGVYNIPFGKHSKCLICDAKNILEVSQNLRDIELSAGDYKAALQSATKGDLIYLDPPYIPISKTSNFTKYQKEGFDLEEHICLRDLVMELHHRGCYVAVSNSSCEKSRYLYSARLFTIHTLQVARLVHFSKKIVPEILAVNFTGRGLSK